MMRHKLFTLITAIVLTIFWLTTCSNSNPAPPATRVQSGINNAPSFPARQGTDGSTSGNTNRTVFLIVMENSDWSQIEGSAAAPYINTKLLPLASYASQYYNPPNLHPSEPNYLWLEAGTNFGITNDKNPDTNHQSTTMHLVTLLEQKGISWRSYQEGISGTDCPLVKEHFYAPKHNPMIFFDDVTDTNNPASTYCISHNRPFSELVTDLQHNTVARYNFITPNLCNDMHGNVECVDSNRVKNGDDWLAHNIPAILNSEAYADGGVLFITWDEGNEDTGSGIAELISKSLRYITSDEGSGSDGPIGLLILSPQAKRGGYCNTIHYTHSSLLRTIQEIFGVTPLLGDAAQVTNLSDLFITFP